MNVVTCADSKFFSCLVPLARSVQRAYGRDLIVYDLGLTKEQRRELQAVYIAIDVDPEYAELNSRRNVKTTHKPHCVEHYLKTYDEPMMLVDADCFFTERVEETGFDFGVTFRHYAEQSERFYVNGMINAGVMFFNGGKRLLPLIEKWIEGCEPKEATDQSAMSEILSEVVDWTERDRMYDWYGLSVKIFDGEIYNDVLCRSGKIFHFKSVGRKEERYDRFERFHRGFFRHPKLAALKIQWNRLLMPTRRLVHRLRHKR